MSIYTKKRIQEIEKLVNEIIPIEIRKGITVNEYLNEYRITLNLTVIQAIFGVKFKETGKADKKVKMRFNHMRANIEELRKIAALLNNFVERVETPFMEANNHETVVDIDDDMDIPDKIVSVPGLPTLEKVSNKKIYSYIFGGEGNSCIGKMLITGNDVYEIAAVAKRVKDVKTRNTILIIGGIAIVAAGTAATIYIVNNKNKDEAEGDVDVDNIDVDAGDVDVDVDDVDDIDFDMDDVPTVDLID